MLRLYAIYDLISGIYMPPFTARTDGVVMRDIAAAVSDKKTTLGQHPQDYQVYYVGDFNDMTGLVVPGGRDLICDCITLVKDP